MSFFGLFGPPNIEKLKTEHNIKGLIKALGYNKDIKVRIAALQALGDIGDAQAVEPLLSIIRSSIHFMDKYKDKTIREEASSALEKISDPAAVNSLIAALQDKEYSIRIIAVRALKRCGTPQAVEPLAEFLRGEPILTDAVEALEKIGDQQAIKHLIMALGYNRYSSIRVAAAEALGRIGGRGAQRQIEDLLFENLDPLLVALRDSDMRVHQVATQVFDQIKEPPVEILITFLTSQPWYIRKYAATKLRNLGWQPQDDIQRALLAVAEHKWDVAVSCGAAAINPLSIVINDELDYGKPAVDALGQIRDMRTVEPLVATLNSKYYRTSAEILEKLGWQPKDDRERALWAVVKGQWEQAANLGTIAAEPLANALQKHSLDPNDKTLAAHALARVDATQAANILLSSVRAKPKARFAISEPNEAQLAISELTSVVERFAPNITSETLRSIASLDRIVQTKWSTTGNCGNPYLEEDEVDCSRIRQLARQELIRRGFRA